MKKTEEVSQKVLAFCIMLAVSVGITVIAAYFYGNSFRTIFVSGIEAGICFLLNIYCYVLSINHKSLHFDNAFHVWRYTGIIYLGLICCVFFPLFPETGWVFPAFALAFTIFSNTSTGISAYIGMLVISFSLTGGVNQLFVVYLLAGIFVTIIFENIDKEYKIGLPLLASILIYGISLFGYIVFSSNGTIGYEEFLIPIINIVISFLLMLAVLKLYCALVVDKEKGEYIDINDQEFSLLAKYKEIDSGIYFNAIHTAYFTEKIARSRNMDINLAKNGAYYYRVIVAECKRESKSLEEICEEYHFPTKAITQLQELNYKSKVILRKETAVVFLVESVISSILFLMQKEQNKDVDYGKVAGAVIKRRLESGALKYSDLSFGDIQEIEKILIGEKLYYDFLRRE